LVAACRMILLCAIVVGKAGGTIQSVQMLPYRCMKQNKTKQNKPKGLHSLQLDYT
jgi:hypothetical protein